MPTEPLSPLLENVEPEEEQESLQGRSLSFDITSENAGIRLDRFLLAQEELDYTRSFLQKLIKGKQILVDGKSVKAGTRLQPGNQISVEIPPPAPLEASPQDIPLDILYEDSHLVVVNKPAGMVVHPSIGHPDGTLVNALLYHCGDLSGIGGALRPGIVHRLDKDTSGVLVVAKNDQAHQGLKKLFQERPKDRLDRRYLAVVAGTFKEDSGKIDTFHNRHPVHRKRFTSRCDRGRRAVTHYWVRERFEKVTLLELKLETGRTHQIRVHLSDRNRPLLGDALYDTGMPPSLPKRLLEFPRQALHAFRLAFAHPIHQDMVECQIDPPEDMTTLLNWLRKTQS